jgi:YfiH family protein
VRETPAGEPGVPRLELAPWADRHGLVAGITQRPFNLGLSTDDGVRDVVGRWRELREAFAGRFASFVVAHQVHGRTIRWYEHPADGWLITDDVDGHATRQAGVLLTVTVADCVPIYLCDPTTGATALLHAGWRGVAACILDRAVELLRERAGAAPGDLLMHCGVGICGDCYEVGPEVTAALGIATPPQAATGVPARVDLRGVLARQAAALGIGAVTTSAWCTAHDRDRFFSHRASGGRDGRMIAYLGRPACSP